MTRFTRIAGPLTALALTVGSLGATASADSELPLQDVADQIVREVRLLPNASGGSGHQSVTATVRNDTVVLMGMLDSNEERAEIDRIIHGIDGLHMNQIDDHIVVQ